MCVIVFELISWDSNFEISSFYFVTTSAVKHDIKLSVYLAFSMPHTFLYLIIPSIKVINNNNNNNKRFISSDK